MEIFGRSPYSPDSAAEWVVFVAVIAAIVLSATLASDWPAAALMTFAAIAAYLFDSAIYIPLGIATAGVTALAFRGQTSHYQSGRRALREGAICSLVFTLYEVGRHAVLSGWEPALANGESIVRFERRLNLDMEPSLQHLVLRHKDVMHWVNSAYSWFFLPVVAGALFWLYITQDELYRRFRSSLAISAVFAVVLIALFPVAPPRLLPGSNLIGTHALVGGSHSFVNQFAAVPSLHVGWVALSCVALFAGVRHWMRWVWLVVPWAVMWFTVMATGHHYFVDGLIGSMVTLVPFIFFTWRSPQRRASMRTSVAQSRLGTWANAAAREIADAPKVRFTTYSLAVLLTYMVVRQIVDAGFTNYWGYMVAQIAVTIVVMLWISVHFSPQGGLSLLTHGIIVVTTYADTLGTAGHMYDRFITYDKVTHFLGSAAVASACGDIMLAMARKGTLSWSPRKIMLAAVGVAIGFGAGWEIYEYFGDKLLNTGRHAGAEDTFYDIISDSVGAIVAAAFLFWWHFSSEEAMELEAANSGTLAIPRSSEDDREA